ncbi:MAG: phosphate ABC transporter permease PstA, partial [Actinomycetota bacterium]|nr:phosphate ABC transporter permease PstA [Actinomycetota bacterium]
SGGLRTSAERAGVFQAIRGTFWIGIFVVVFSFPVGVATAVYLEEYANQGRLVRFLEVNIRNLAGVPSIVYGILGLTIFVQTLKSVTNGQTLLSAGITLAILVLPIVIITASEAVRAVPRSLREAAYGVGATRWEVTRSHVVPYALPGIITGTVLALARALGEAAPLLLCGAVTGLLPGKEGLLDPSQLTDRFTALPVVIADWARTPRAGFDELAAAAIIVMLAIVLVMNTVAILLRTRYEQKRK